MLKSLNAASTQVFNATGDTVAIISDLARTARTHSGAMRAEAEMAAITKMAVIHEQMKTIAKEDILAAKQMLTTSIFD
jgi:soluble P-type ATPase